MRVGARTLVGIVAAVLLVDGCVGCVLALSRPATWRLVYVSGIALPPSWFWPTLRDWVAPVEVLFGSVLWLLRRKQEQADAMRRGMAVEPPDDWDSLDDDERGRLEEVAEAAAEYLTRPDMVNLHRLERALDEVPG